jgi:hypothetical protein
MKPGKVKNLNSRAKYLKDYLFNPMVSVLITVL